MKKSRGQPTKSFAEALKRNAAATKDAEKAIEADPIGANSHGQPDLIYYEPEDESPVMVDPRNLKASRLRAPKGDNRLSPSGKSRA
jgi:hypothetical protein